MRINICLVFLLTSNCICCYVNAAEKFGAPTEADPKNPKYQKMAEEVVRSHLHIEEKILKKIRVDKVTTQVVAGFITRLKFKVFFVNGASTNCSADILEQPQLNTKMVLYNCDSLFGKKQLSPSSSGPKQPRDPKNPKYKKLAHLALDSFLSTPGRKPFKKEDIQSISVAGAKVQISSRIANFIIFDVNTVNNGQFKCKGAIIETPWQTNDTVKVTGMNCKVKKGDNADSSTKVSLSSKKLSACCPIQQNPSDPEYSRLAKKAFVQYLKSHTSVKIGRRKVQIDRVATESEARNIIEIDFHVYTARGARPLPCNSIIRKNTNYDFDFKVTCQLEDEHVGDKQEQNPNQLIYRSMAIQSFKKYLTTSNDPHGARVKNLKVTKATTQMVSGVLTRLEFDVITVLNTKYQCRSEVLEQPWLERKDIKVDCNMLKNDESKTAPENSPDSSDEVNKRLGGETEQDPSDPMYKQLAKESLERFEESQTKSRFNIKSLEVTKVTTQVVAGVLTRLDFHVHTAVSNIGYICHSDIFEQTWLKVKEVIVKCKKNHRTD